MECGNCNKEISATVAKYSQDKFGKLLCVNCQKKDNYWQNKEQREIEKSRQIQRHGAINSAIELCKAKYMVKINYEELCALADKILEYVNKEEGK